MITIKILLGSTRPGRFGIQPAKWIYEIAKKRTDINVELLDLAEINLPFLDEQIPPSQHKYQNEHTKKWAETVGEADGFIFISPEYNHSYSAAIKNAIDFIFQEWHYKPVSFVGYGSVAGGTRAIEHLRAVVAETKMYDLRESMLFPSYWEHLNEKGEYKFTEAHENRINEILDELVFWSKSMKYARGKMKHQESDFPDFD